MSVTSGFFNSINHDRRYDAIQLSSIFDGIITDGVFATVGDAFLVTPTNGSTVSVGTGRAWFNHVWLYNDAPLLLTLDEPEVLLNRCDAIVIEINHTESVRAGTIKIVKGTPVTGAPPEPTLTNNEYVHQYPIATITRNAGSSEIGLLDVTNYVGSDIAPFVTGILKTVSIEALFAKWQAEWDKWYEYHTSNNSQDWSEWFEDTTKAFDHQVMDYKNEFETWFESVKGVLEEDAATSLAAKIVELQSELDATKANEEKLLEMQSILNAPEVRKNTFRGKSLGTSVTAEQLAEIQNGTFTDMYLGDYWEGADGVIWRIVDLDYWLKTGDTSFASHHLVIMPDSPIFTSSLNVDANTSAGYAGCEARVNRATSWKVPCDNMFPGMILTHREYLTNAVGAEGYPTGGDWYDSDVELPNEIMMYGCHIFTPSTTGSFDIKRYTVSKTQLALFRVCPQYIVGETNGARKDCWLRDIANIARFAFVSKNAEASYGNADGSKGFRPVFAIG